MQGGFGRDPFNLMVRNVQIPGLEFRSDYSTELGESNVRLLTIELARRRRVKTTGSIPRDLLPHSAAGYRPRRRIFSPWKPLTWGGPARRLAA